MIVVRAQSDHFLFPRKILEQQCSIFHNVLDTNDIRLPFPPRHVALFLKCLRWIQENRLPDTPVCQFVRPRLTNKGQWRFSFDLESYVGREMFSWLKDKKEVEGMLLVWHYLDCACMNKLASAAYMYHCIMLKN